MSNADLFQGMDSPYPGLRPFRKEESEVFFGREEHIERLLNKLETNRFVAVVGASGCGKSSLVRAGLLPMLEQGFMVEAGENWRVATMRPGDAPFDHLVQALLEESALGNERGSDQQAAMQLETTLRRGRLGLVETMQETLLPEATNLLVLVDQFEEIFRYRQQQDSVDDAEAFVDLLLAAAQHPSQVSHSSRVAPVYVVITMRSDFYGECSLFLGLPEVINESQLLTPRLSREECQAAIQGPARALSGNLDKALVNRLLNDMRDLLGEASGGGDQLPLLQHALMRMWKTAQSADQDAQAPTLTVDDLEAAGGLHEALSIHADEALNQLDSTQQRIAEVMFRCLCELGPGRRAIRRLAKISSVAAIAGVPAEEVMRVADAFRRSDRSFLMPPQDTPLTPDTVLDISHESLIRQWTRLRAWANEEAQSADTYRRVSETAQLWSQGAARLWGTPDLDVAEQWRLRQAPTPQWAERYGEDFSLSMKFLDASVREREKRHRRRRMQIAGVLAASIFVALVSVGAVFVFARLNSELKVTNALLETKTLELEVANSQLETNKLELEVANSELEEKNDQLDQAFAESRRSTYNAQLARIEDSWRDDPQLAIDILGDSVRCPKELQEFSWRVYHNLTKSQGRYLAGHQAAVTCLDHSPSGELIASGDAKGRVILWNRASESKQETLPLDFAFVRSLAFSPDGSTLVVAGDQKDVGSRVELWDVPNKQVTKAFDTAAPVRCVAFSPDGRTLAVAGDDRKVTLRSWPEWNRDQTLAGEHSDWITCLAFSPDGTKLATGSRDTTIRIWATTSGEHLARLTLHTDVIRDLCFSPRGELLASCGDDGTIRLWDAKRLSEARNPIKQTLNPAAGAVHSVSMLKENDLNQKDHSDQQDDERTYLLVSGNDDGSLTFWNVETASESEYERRPDIHLRRNNFDPQKPAGHDGAILQVSFSADGQSLVTGGSDTRIFLWDPRVGLSMNELDIPTHHAIISPGGQCVVGTDEQGNVSLRDQLTDRSSGLSTRVASRSDAELVAAFSPDEQTLALVNGPNLELWDIADRNRPTMKSIVAKNADDVVSLCFVDKSRLAIRRRNGAVEIKDGQNTEHITEDGKPVIVNSMSSHAGRLALGCEDGHVRIWDGKELRDLRFDLEYVISVAFSKDGEYLAAGSDSGEIIVWHLSDNSFARTFAHTQGVTALAFTRKKDESWTLATASKAGTIRLWDPETAEYRGRLLGHVSAVHALAFSDDVLLSADASSLKVWDGRELEPAASMETTALFPSPPVVKQDGLGFEGGNPSPSESRQQVVVSGASAGPHAAP